MENVGILVNALATLAWPLLIGIVVISLWPLVRDIARNRSFSIKYGETSLTVQDASDQLRKQVEDLQEQVATLLESPRPARARRGATRARNTGGEGATILWVDDKPKNNAYEIEKFRDDGFRVVQVQSTSEAEEWIAAHGAPAIVITDMGRKEAGRFVSDAGLQLIRNLRDTGVEAAVFVYTSKEYAQRHHDQTLEAGGNGATASPLALYQMVAKAKA